MGGGGQARHPTGSGRDEGVGVFAMVEPLDSLTNQVFWGKINIYFQHEGAKAGASAVSVHWWSARGALPGEAGPFGSQGARLRTEHRRHYKMTLP